MRGNPEVLKKVAWRGVCVCFWGGGGQSKFSPFFLGKVEVVIKDRGWGRARPHPRFSTGILCEVSHKHCPSVSMPVIEGLGEG